MSAPVSELDSLIALPSTLYTTSPIATSSATPTAYSANSAPVSSFKKFLSIVVCSFGYLGLGPVLIPHEIFLDRKKTVTEVQASSQADLSPTLLPITATLQRV